MTLSTKAIIAALALSLTPALASATGVNNTYAGGAIFSPLQVTGGVAQNPTGGTQWIPSPINGGQPVPTPVQGMDCGASHMQALLGHHVSVAQSSGINARYFTPDSPYGTMDYQPHRLNVRTNTNYIIDRVYCG